MIKPVMIKGGSIALAAILVFTAFFLLIDHRNKARAEELRALLEENSRQLEECLQISRKAASDCDGLTRRMDESDGKNERAFASINADIASIKKELRRLGASAGTWGPQKTNDVNASSLSFANQAVPNEAIPTKDTFISATMAKSQRSLENRKYREASDGFHAVLRVDGENAKAKVFATVSDYYIDPKQFDGDDGLVNLLEDYLAKAGDDPIVLKTLSSFYSDEGDWGATAKYLGRMVEKGFADRDDCLLAANASMLAGDCSSGRRYYDLAIRKSPKDASIAYRAGKAFEKARLAEEAITYYKRALEMDPEFGPAKEALASMTTIGGIENAVN